MGTIFRFSGLVELLVELAPSLHGDSKIKFFILGDGEDFNRLQHLTKTLGLQEQVIMPGRIEYDLLSDYLRLGHVGLLPFKQELVTHGALPGKVLQYLACGLPTIATPLDGLMSMTQANNGVFYSSSPHQLSVDAIQLVSEPKTHEAMKNSRLNLIRTKGDWEQQIIQFENVVTTPSKDINKGTE